MSGFFDIPDPKQSQADAGEVPGKILEALSLFCSLEKDRPYLGYIHIKRKNNGEPSFAEATDRFGVLRFSLEEPQLRALLDAMARSGPPGDKIPDEGFQHLYWMPPKIARLQGGVSGFSTGVDYPTVALDKSLARAFPHGPADREHVRPFIAFAQQERVSKLYRLLEPRSITYSNFKFGGIADPTVEDRIVEDLGEDPWKRLYFQLLVMPAVPETWS